MTAASRELPTPALGWWVPDVTTLVADVPAGARIGVSGFHFTRAPIAQLRALPPTATDLTYISWGGGLPLEVLLDRGLVTRATLCFSSLDVLGPAPRFRRAVETGALDLDEWTALGMINALRAAGENTPYAVLAEPAGSSLTDVFTRPAANPFARPEEIPTRAVPALSMDYLLLHVQRADDDGNVEIAGARGLDMSMIFAARHVLVSVEERVRRGDLGAPRSLVLPRTFVTALTLAPGGAYPTSCLPYYPTDYQALREIVAAGPDTPVPDAALTPTTERLAVLERHARVPAARFAAAARALASAPDPDAGLAPTPATDPAPTAAPDLGYTPDELMVAVLARTVAAGAICSVGSASPLPTAAYLLAKHLWAPDLLVMSHNGGFVDLPVRPLSLAVGEMLDHELAVAHTGGDETYHWYYQRGLVTHEVVGSAQVDRTGATNNLWVSRRDGSRVRLPGQGGMADVSNLHANFIIYLPRQSPRNTPESVETVSAARTWHDASQREGYGLRPGRTLVVTDLAVFAYDARAGGLVVSSLHPGVSLDHLREQTGFALTTTSDPVTTTEPPTPEELTALRNVIDPLGIRRLDMVGAVERQGLIDSILDVEESLLDDLTLTLEQR